MAWRAPSEARWTSGLESHAAASALKRSLPVGAGIWAGVEGMFDKVPSQDGLGYFDTRGHLRVERGKLGWGFDWSV